MMASRHEKFIEEQRRRADNIRSSALNGTLRPTVQQPKSVTSRSDAFKKFISSNPPASFNDPDTIPEAMRRVGSDRITGSTLYQATQGNRKAINDYKAATGREIKPVQGPPAPSQHQLNENAINAKARESSFANFVAPYSRFMNDLTYGNKVGQFITRSVGTGGGMLLGTPSQAPASTGNKTADKVADVLGIAGGIAGAGFNPSAGGNLITAPLRGVSGALNTRAGQALTGGVSRATRVSQPVARAGIEGAATGAIGGVAAGLVQGQDSNKDILTNAGLGAGLGAVGDIAIRGIGAGVNRLRNNLQSRQVSVPNLVDDATAPQAGISGLNRGTAYSKSSLNDTKSQIRSRNDIEVPSVSGLGNKLYTSLVDDVHQLNVVDKTVEKVLGKQLDPTESVHKQALSTRGADVVAQQIVTDGMVDSMGNVSGESLKSILSQVPRGKFVDFEDYLINKHAITRSARNEKVFRDELNWTPEAGEMKINEYEAAHPQFKEMSEKLYEFNNNMVQKWLVDTGMITREQAQAWLEANPYYVPNKRYFSDLEKGNQSFGSKGKGFGNVSTPVKGYQKGGSQRQIISPIEATIENVDAYVKAAKRNQVMQTLVNNLRQAPDELRGFAEIVEQPTKPDDITKAILDGDGLDDLLSRFSEDFDKAMQITKLDKDNIVRVLVNGEAVHVKINDKALLDAVTALGPESGGKLIDAVGWVTNKMKMLTTGANPIFNLTRNVFRDIPQAYIASKSTGNPIRFVGDLVQASIEVFRDGDLFRQYKAMGGGHSSSVAANRNLLAQSKRSVLPQPLLKNAVPRAWSAMENLMNTIESAPRLAEYKRLSKNGDGTPADLMKALYEAQDLTTNFKRRGAITRELDKVFPYFNAAIQGMDKFVRTYKDDPVKASIKSMMALTIPTLVAYAVNHDNPDYQKVSNRIKDQFILIPKGDGTFIRIAKPQEMGVLFSAIPERLMRQLQDEDPAAFREFSDTLRNTFLPPGIQAATKEDTNIADRILGDTIFGPLTQIAANKNFADAPIVPGYLERLSPELQSDARTSSVSKWIGEKTGQSPKQLDHLIRSYTGVIGQLGLPMLSPSGQGNNVLQSLGNSVVQNMSTDPVYSNDISTEFYQYKDQLDQANTDKNYKELPEWYDDGLRKSMNRISTSMGDIRKDMRALEGDTTMDRVQKRAQLRTLQQSINELAQQGIEMSKGKVPYK